MAQSAQTGVLQSAIGRHRPRAGEVSIGLIVPWLACIVVALAAMYVAGPLVGRYWSNVLQQVGIAAIAAVSLNIVNGLTGQFSMGHAGFMAVGGYIAAGTTYYGSLLIHGSVGDPAFYTGGVALMLVGLVLGAMVAGGFGYVVGLPSLRLRGDYLAIVTLGFGEIIRVVLELTSKQADARALVPIAGLMAEKSPAAVRSLVTSIPADVSTAEAMTIVAPFAARPEDVASLAAAATTAEVGLVRTVWETPVAALTRIPLGGPTGFFGVPPYAGLLWIYFFLAATCVVAYRMKVSSSGRAFLSIREDEIAARAMGIDLTKYKVRAFVLAAMFAGVAGALYAHIGVNPSPTDAGFLRSFEVIIFVVLGGLGSISGAAIAAAGLTILGEALRGPEAVIELWPVLLGITVAFGVASGVVRAVKNRGWRVLALAAAIPLVLLGFALLSKVAASERIGVRLGDYRMILYSLLLISTMLVRPNGLMGVREIWDEFGPMRGTPERARKGGA